MLPDLDDPFALFRFVITILSLWEIGTVLWDVRLGYLRWHRTLGRIADGRYLLHDLLHATVRHQLWRVIARTRGWEDLRLLLVLAAATSLSLLTFLYP